MAAYQKIDYNPVMSTWGGREWRQHELSSHTSLGIHPDEAAELMHMRQIGRTNMARLILKARVNGIARVDIDMVVTEHPDGVSRYIELRRDGVSHSDAAAEAATVHLHRFGGPELLEDFCKVLGTGTRTVRHTCVACGYRETHSERRNWSGD